MTFPEHLASVLDPATRETWTQIAEVVPAEAYLVGGTAVAAHIGHRRSRDLDFYLEKRVDLDALERTLDRVGTLAVTDRDEGTLNCVLDGTVVQFVDASNERVVEPTILVAGIRVASIGDLLATKLNAITHRPALRDYVDVQAIEERVHRYVEEGLALFVERYRPRVPDEALAEVVRALASFEDVAEDPALDVTVAHAARFWRRRVPEITKHLGRWS